MAIDLKKYIGRVPDYPKPGILFYDISPLLADADAWHVAMGRVAKAVSRMVPDVLVGVESRGFLVAAPLAEKLGMGFIMVRKKGKLPGKTISYEYDLEYGKDTIEIQENAIKKGDKVVILDDLIATGGTLLATSELLRKVGAEVVGVASIIELSFLGAREKLDVPVFSVIDFEK